MPSTHTSERSGGLVESHHGYNPRLLVFYLLITLMLLVLGGGLAQRQLMSGDLYQEKERNQNQRRVLTPGPRGNIFDRRDRLLAGNRPRFALTLQLDELRREFRQEFIRSRRAYREAGVDEPPSPPQMERIARYTVVMKYLEQVNRITGRADTLDPDLLQTHFQQQLLLPFVLLDDLHAEEYARLAEQLPVTSPLQLFTASRREYPYGRLAAHTLGYVSASDEVEAPAGYDSQDFATFTARSTFKMKGTIGREGVEKYFDEHLQGETGVSIFRVDPAGYRVYPSLFARPPVRGRDLHLSLDIDLQRAASAALAETEMAGAAVAIDVTTGEVLVLASKPDYDLRSFVPRLAPETVKTIDEEGAWLHRAVSGLYPPGSSFKLITAAGALRAGVISPETIYNCPGYEWVGGRQYPCHGGHAHGDITVVEAMEKSCNVFFYKAGLALGPERLAAESRRYGLGTVTGIELSETRNTLVPDPIWKMARREQKWFPGDTANVAIGQGDLLVTPLQMATATAGFARDETSTVPSLIHDPDRLPQHTTPTGLTSAQRAAIVSGMEQCTITGTAKILNAPFMKLSNLRIAGKTGTAQKETPHGTINYAWFICFVPVERPRIAIAVVVEGDTPGEETAGGRYAVPVAHAILKTWQENMERKTSVNDRNLLTR